MKKALTSIFAVAIFAAMSLSSSAQTTNVALINNTPCDLQIVVAGATSATSCSPVSWPLTVVNGNSAAMMSFPMPLHIIGAAGYGTGAGPWVQANTPVYSFCYTQNSGTSACGSYTLSISGNTVTAN